MDKNEELLKLFEGGKFEDALKFIYENKDANPSVNNDYGLRDAIYKGKYDVAKELMKRGCKLSSVRYEAVNVFLEKTQKDYDIFKFIFSNIDPRDPNAPTVEKILITGNGITFEQLDLLMELGFVDIVRLQELSKRFIFDWTLSISPVFKIFLKYNIEMPRPTSKIMESFSKSIDIFKYYYKNYKEEVIEYYKENSIPYTLIMCIIDNNMTDIADCKKLFGYLIQMYAYNYNNIDLDHIEKYIIANLDDLKDVSIGMGRFCRDSYDGLEEIEESDIEALKLLLKYNLIDIRADDDLFYHHAHITNSEKAIEFIDWFYLLQKVR